MRVSLIAAIASNGVIGRDNNLPWDIADDMNFFTKMTQHRVVITGRRNYDAMGRALPERTNLVVSRRTAYSLPDAQVVPSVEVGLAVAQSKGETETFVIGGAQIYALALPYAHRFYRTRVLQAVPGDVKFPPFDEAQWQLTPLQRGDASSHNEMAFAIERLDRLRPPRDFP